MVNLLKNIFAFVKRHPVKIRIFMVCVLFTILIYNVRPGEIFAAFRQARPLYLMYALLLLVPNLLLQFLKWNFLLKDFNPRPPFITAVTSVLGGFFLGASTPGRTGELARGLFIPGHSKIKVASLTVVDKGFNQIMTYLFGLASLSYVLPWPFSAIPIIAGMVIVTILINIHRTRPLLENFFHRYTKSERVDNILAAFDALSAGKVMGMLTYSIPFYAVYTFQYCCLIHCFSDISIFSAMKTIPLIFMINTMFPIAIGDFGVKEMAAVHVLGAIGISGGAAFSATLIQNVISFLVPSVAGGIVFTFYRPRQPQEAPASDGRKALALEK